jgi:hypothetical protein
MAQALEALDSRRLPGAVGADQADDLAGVNVEVQSIHDGAGPIGLRQTSHFNDWIAVEGS